MYKTYANKLTKVKALSKKLYLKKEIVNSSHDMRKFCCIMKTLLPHKPTWVLSNYIHEEGQIIDTPLDIADKFNNHFCRLGKVLAEKIKPSNLNNFQQYLCNRVCSSMFLNPTSTFEICCIINQLNVIKSCGSDGIEAKFIVLAAEVLSSVLAILFNACFDFGIFPTCLKTAKVVPIYKAGDINEVTNYRPISILSIFSKILEKLVHTRKLFFKCHSALTSTQYGFRPKYSTFHALLDITNSASDNIEKKLYTGLVFLDLTKAFDTVNHSILLYNFEHYGIRGIVNNFFGSFLSNRNQYVTINKTNFSLKFIDIEVPQGSILGPLHFLIYINDIPNSVKCTPRLFADDTCLLMGAPSTTILENQLKDDLNNIFNWISANNLTLNLKKSQLLIIAPNLKFSNDVLNTQSPACEIKTIFKAKYLGILFDNRLNFFAHIKILEVKIVRSVGILNKLKYFLPSSALLKLYYALIHSHFNYGLAVWESIYPTYLNKLKLLQNKAIPIVTSSHMSTSSKPLYIKSNILPLPKLFEFEIAKIVYFYKFNL